MAHGESDTPGAGRSQMTQIGGVEGTGAKLCPVCEARYAERFRACTRDGTALVDVDDTVGTTLSGTYFVRRVLGEGAMGKVFEARHTRLPAKRFAIKMLHPEYVKEPQILGRFAREAEAAASIDHPNAAGVVDVDRTPDGRPFLVSELLQGKELGDFLIERGRMPVPAAVRVAAQIANAIVAAHARGIIHRDLKPENVFLTGDLTAPVAKVLDFGMARLERGEHKALTQAGAVLGTPSFMPPEQARGEPVDHRADVYAVGAILYTALTGQRPFDRASPAETLLAVLTDEPPRPRSIEPAIPEGLEVVVLRAMARDVSSRYGTMEALARALAPFDPTATAAPMSQRPAQTLPDTAGDDLVTHAHLALGGVVGLAFAWAACAMAAAAASLVRATHPSASALSAVEIALVVGLVVAALVPPLILVVQATRSGPWKSPIAAAAAARRAAPHLGGVLVTYGAAAASVRALEAVFGRGRGVWVGWDIVLLFAGALGALWPFARSVLR